MDMTGNAGEVLCAASAYEEKYYLNPKYERLPEAVRDELKIICVLFTEEIGGRFVMEFTPEGELQMRTEALDSDYNYDENGAGLMCREIRNRRADLMKELELYHQVITGKSAWRNC